LNNIGEDRTNNAAGGVATEQVAAGTVVKVQ